MLGSLVCIIDTYNFLDLRFKIFMMVYYIIGSADSALDAVAITSIPGNEVNEDESFTRFFVSCMASIIKTGNYLYS
jgi:hypothetical protein